MVVWHFSKQRNGVKIAARIMNLFGRGTATCIVFAGTMKNLPIIKLNGLHTSVNIDEKNSLLSHGSVYSVHDNSDLL